jgi:NDP-sugar pyrophosphorylase family protein
MIANKVQINQPVMIGNNVRIHKGAVIGPDTVIGNNVIIDAYSRVRGSIVLDKTYVGQNLEIKHKIACGHALIDPGDGTGVRL